MKKTEFKERADLYQNYLLENVMPFWMQYSPDKQYGGFFTCIDRKGVVFDKDKFVWLQCRQVWTLAKLYQNVEKNEAWLSEAVSGAEFLIKHGRDAAGDWYFSLDETGKSLVQPYNIFSDCFATMAFGQLYAATENEEYKSIAKDTFYRILTRIENPKGKYNKLVSGTRDMKSFSLPMILCNLVMEIEDILDPEIVESTLQFGVKEVMEVFYKEEFGLVLENLDMKGNPVDSFEGRLINPGHGLEAMWFIMDIATKWNDKELIRKSVDISLKILNYGWDSEYQGILYFKDLKGFPPQQLEWDQKLWWVHLEAMICTLKGYKLTGNRQMLEWYERLHEYTWKHFVDPKYGEMFGYLNRHGEVLLDLKGGKWKGCFHVPRALYQLSTLSNELAEMQTDNSENIIKIR